MFTIQESVQFLQYEATRRDRDNEPGVAHHLRHVSEVLGGPYLSAVKTLKRLGYTYENGEEWQPPLGSEDQITEKVNCAFGEIGSALGLWSVLFEDAPSLAATNLRLALIAAHNALGSIGCKRSTDKRPALTENMVIEPWSPPLTSFVKELQKRNESVDGEAISRVLLGQGELHVKPAGPSAPALLDQAAKHMRDRAATYDKPEGERSMGKTVEAFNAVTGRDLRESEGWLLLALLKMVRSEQRAEPHVDSVEDLVAYSALFGEARLGSR